MKTPNTLLLGPLLGYERDGYYTVCFLASPDLPPATNLEVSTGAVVAFAEGGNTPTGKVWRAEVQIAPTKAGPQTVTYRIKNAAGPVVDRQDRAEWKFHVPALGERARLGYAACNGFSSPDLAANTEHPYIMWEKLADEHRHKPFSLLLMGGDQLYADSVLSLPGVKEWTEKSHPQMKAYQPSAQLIARLDAFYDELYQKRWAEKTMSLMLATIPTVMMWDDHDIVDGWGSHDDIPQRTPMYDAIYQAARKYFRLHQLRTTANRSLLDRTQHDVGKGHFALGFDFADFRVLVMDHRSERSLTRVMSEAQHQVVKAWMAAPSRAGDPLCPVLALSGIPVVYRSFAALESTMESTPWTEEATDDVRDHWMASRHRGERTRLIKNLIASPSKCVWLLSGDVHVGALGEIRDTETVPAKSIFQVISTGIVHPPPGALAWAGLWALTNDDPETLPGTGITTRMLTPNHGPRYIRDRNFATLQRSADGKLWVNWICEDPSSAPAPEFVA